jgi:hypothetical protein
VGKASFKLPRNRFPPRSAVKLARPAQTGFPPNRYDLIVIAEYGGGPVQNYAVAGARTGRYFTFYLNILCPLFLKKIQEKFIDEK